MGETSEALQTGVYVVRKHWVRTAKVGGDCGTRIEILVWGDSGVDV